MGTIESFGHNYNKKSPAVSCDSWEAKESQDGAHFKRLVFRKSGCVFFTLDSHFIEPEKFVHQTVGDNLRDKNCDAACIWNESEGDSGENEVLMMVELKSKFSSSEIRDAFMQTIYSYLRMHMAMSLCDGYDCKAQTLRLCVGCQRYDTDSYTKVIEKISKLKEAKIEGFNTVVLYKLLQGHTVAVRFGRLLEFYRIELKLPRHLLDKDVQMNLYLTKDVSDETLEVAL